MTIFFIPAICNAIICSLVCGCGHSSFTATSSNAPSIIVLPDNMVAIKLSCPGASTMLIFLNGVAGELHFAQSFLTPYDSVSLAAVEASSLSLAAESLLSLDLGAQFLHL